MTPDTLRLHSRCRSLALAAMVSAAGKPAHVAAKAAASPPPATAAPRRSPPAAGSPATSLSSSELARLAGLPPRLLAAIDLVARKLASIPAAAPRPRPLARVARPRSGRGGAGAGGGYGFRP
jgi:hypothetical protein